MPNTDKLLRAVELEVGDEALKAQLRVIIAAAATVVDSSRLNAGAKRRVDGYAYDALQDALQGVDLEGAWERIERFRHMPWASQDTSPSGVYRSAYARWRERCHREGKHGRGPDPNCVLCPSPHGRPSEHGLIIAYDDGALDGIWDQAGVVERACRTCQRSPRRVYRCPECGTQCWDCSRSAHEQEAQDQERWQSVQTTS